MAIHEEEIGGYGMRKEQRSIEPASIPPEFQRRATFRVGEVEDISGIPAETIRGWVFRRKLPCSRVGRVVLISRATVQKLLAGELH